MTDEKLVSATFIDRFERNLISEDSFHHADHVRLAFEYISNYPPLEALGRFATALQRFAAARGKSQRYHETITYAYFFLIRERMARAIGIEWDDFAKLNPDLLQWKPGILSLYYREKTLQSELARSIFLFPDKFAEF